MTVIGSGTSLEGDRWVLGRDVYDGLSYTYLEVETPERTPGMTTLALTRSSSELPMMYQA